MNKSVNKSANPKLMKTRRKSIRFNSGYTLVELLIAMAIGLFILAGAFQVTHTNKKSNRLQKNLLQTQNNGRFSINNLSYAIKTAGYSGFYGKFSTSVENLINLPGTDKWDISKPVSGHNNVASTATIAGITGFKPNTDVILLKGMKSNVLPLISNDDSSTIEIDDNNDFVAGDVVIVTDVDQASMFQISNIANSSGRSALTLNTAGTTPGNSTLLDNSFGTDAQISKYNPQLYYIKNGRDGEAALFVGSLSTVSGVAQLQENELVSNISNMQVNFGIDSDDDQIINEYKDASTITDWSEVISINVALLSSSHEDNVVPNKNSYSYDTNLATFIKDTTPATNADKRLKRVYKMHIPLRN